MATTIDLRGILKPNSASPIFASNYKDGDRPSGGEGAGQMLITGSGFGSKTTGTPYFDNFEGRTVGAANSSSLGGASQLAISNPQYVSIANTGSHSGTKVVRMDYAGASVESQARNSPSDATMFPKIYHELGTRSRYGYAAFWIKWTGSGGSQPAGNIWKFSRFTSGSENPYSDDNILSFTYYAGPNNTGPQVFSGDCKGSITPIQYKGTNSVYDPITEQPNFNPATLFTKDVWHLCEIELDVGSLNTANALVQERWDKTLTCNYDNFTFKTTANPQDIYSIMTPLCGLDDYSNIIMYMDEAYVDGSRCRVVMTNTSTYSSWTKWAIQPIIAYSDTNVTVKKNRGMFTVGDTAYLHVFNSSGVRVHTSSAITVTEDNA
jgi:hypothetical protein